MITLIDLSDIAMDPDLSQPYIIHRKSGTWVNGRPVETEASINTYGVVTNANPKELMQLPEGDRVAGVMVFYNLQPIHTSNSSGTSDQIEWNGNRYRVSTVYDYSGQGFYKAFAVYMEGD